MTIKEMADAYIGYPPEIDESSTTALRRDAYEQGARDILEKAIDVLDWMFTDYFEISADDWFWDDSRRWQGREEFKKRMNYGNK